MRFINLFKKFRKNKKNIEVDALEDMTFEEYFKDKIDWKFFNYLEYKLTRYQDRGITTHINVSIKFSDYRSGYGYVYHKITGKDAEEEFRQIFRKDDKDYSLKTYSEFYEKEGLFYCISFPHVSHKNREKVMNKITEYIKEKSFIYGMNGIFLIIKPKENKQ